MACPGTESDDQAHLRSLEARIAVLEQAAPIVAAVEVLDLTSDAILIFRLPAGAEIGPQTAERLQRHLSELSYRVACVFVDEDVDVSAGLLLPSKPSTEEGTAHV